MVDIQDILTRLTNYTPLTIPTTVRPLRLTFTTAKLLQTATPIQTVRTVIPHPPREVSPALLSSDADSGEKAIDVMHMKPDDPGKQTCEASSVIHNATLKMGMHSGVFTKLGRVKDMPECIKRCCRSANADVAYVLGSMCFAVKCFSQELCKTVPVMMSLIGNLNINPSLSFLTKKEPNELASGTTTDLDTIYNDLTDLSDVEDDFLSVHSNNKTESHSRSSGDGYRKSTYVSAIQVRPTKYSASGRGTIHGEDWGGQTLANNRQDATSLTNHPVQDMISEYQGIAYPGITQSRPNERLQYPIEATPESNYQMCLDSPVTYNVTLRGGISAGNFTEQGEGLTTRECIGKCCDTQQCDLAFMFGDRCYSVACANEGLCQAVLAKPSSLEPKVAYVTKNRNLDYNSEGINFEVNNDENDVCKSSDLDHGPVYINKSLIGGMDAGNYTYLGKSRTMPECISRSCRSKHRDLAYMIDDECFAVNCFSPDLCKISNKTPKNGNVQIAEIFKMVKSKHGKVATLTYVLIGISGFGIGLAGLFAAICFSLKRKKLRALLHKDAEHGPKTPK